MVFGRAIVGMDEGIIFSMEEYGFVMFQVLWDVFMLVALLKEGEEHVVEGSWYRFRDSFEMLYGLKALPWVTF